MTPRTFKHLLCLLAFTQWSYLVEGSHFRHAFMSFAPTGADTNTIRFTFRLAFRRSYSYSYYCDDDTTNRGGIIGSGDSWRAKCSDHLSAVCSQTYNLADTGFRCTDFSSDEDWSMGENNFTYTFPSSNVEWTVSYHSCCWISNLARYASSDWLVSTKIGLSKRSDNGKINSSPVSRSPAIVRFQEGCQKSLIIPVEDPDGDFVKCRWATDAESSIPNDSFSYGELDEKNCVLTYRGGRGASGTYAVTLTLEDFPAGTTNFNNIRPFSAVPLQFLVIISAGSGSCQDIPVFTASTPQKGECLEIQIGSAYIAVIEVRLPNIAKHVVEITTSSPLGMQLTPLRFHGGIYSRNVTWYPNQNQVGQQLFCFQALDSDGLQSEWRCVTILVGLSNTPHVILGTRRPISPMSEIGTGLIWWSIQFDRVIKKPRSTAFIRLVLQSNGFTVFKVDALSGYVIIDSNRTALHFATPKAALSMNGSYAILIDHGAVVGQGCSYDGPPTPGITSPKDWAFPVDGTCPVGYALAPPSFQKCKDIDECGGHYRSKRSYWWWQYSETSANHLPSSIPADISPTPASVTPLSTVSLPAASASCHYNLYGPHGHFSSPNYPQNYGHNLQCAWHITTSPGLYIYLRFDHFHLEGSSGSCPYDYVQIYDGTSHQSLTMRRCDYQDSWCVYSHSNALYVHFKTDGSVSRSGFTAFYEMVSERYPVCEVNSTNHLSSSIPADISPTPALVTPTSTASLPAASASCHSNLYGPHGHFSSPNYPQNYGHNLQCAWHITTLLGFYIYLRFDHFHLEGSSGSCPYDYVQIYDGTSHQSLTMKRCDYQDSWCVYSHSNALYVHFKTDVSVSRSGFTAFYETVSERYSVCKVNSTNHLSSSIPADISPTPASMTPMSTASLPAASASCHYNLYGPHGHFSSPNYPQNYDHYLQCAWHITTLPGFYIYLRFDHLHLEGSSGSCPYDYVQIYDGTSHQSLTMKRCDYQDSWCVYSHSNALYVHFKTDYSVSHSGFTAVYETVSERYSVCKVNSTNDLPSSIPANISPTPALMTPMPTASLPAASASCHYRLYGPHGNFSSPNYPQKYDHYLQCAWHITTSPGLYIYLRFDHFHLEGSSGSCPYDYVQIYDGTSHQILTMKRCDYQDSWCIYSHSNGLYVHFKTDHSVSHTGFTAVYETVSERYSVCKVNSTLNSTNIAPTPSQHLAVTTSAIPGNCFHHLNQLSGSFESPGKPGCYPNNKDCTWLLEAPIGKYVYLQFNSFHLEYGGSHCPWDYVTILDGNSLHSPVVVKACGQLARLRLFSGGRFLMVLFHSDGIINRPGFHAYFQASHYRYNITLPSQQVPMTSQVQCLPIQTQTATPTSSNLQGIHPTPASTMATTFYAASSVNVQPDPSQFQFRLPAECDQSCHNTFGSYTCSCVRGYQLAADRKSCLDVDECSINNGGCSHHCYNIPGSFYCGCPEGTSMGANNLTCVEPGVSVNCSDIMTVALEKKTFPFFDAARLHLRYSSCRATQNNTHLLLRTPLNGCGTLVNETEDDLFFWNEIQTDVVVIDNVITRSHDIKIPFYCGYSRKKWVNLGVKPQHLRFGTEAGYGNFTFKIDFYKSSSFATPYTEQDYPLSVPINQYLYVRYSVESSADLVIMAVTCKATKTGSFYSWPQYSIIQNGCPQDTSMEYNFDPRRNYQQFKIRAFRFFNDYDQVYIHCEVLACHTYSPNSRCSQSCLGSKKRKRRDVTRDEIEHEESTTKVTLTRGPLIIQLEQEQGDTDQNKQTALIGGLAGAGGFALIAVAALAVLFVKYRIARRFMNRNKVGDQYATQDGQLSRRNAYVQPEDMVEHEDAF